MAAGTRSIGRPRKFDEATTLDRALDVFWRRGWTDTTTRVLEAELGMTQSSIYNAFGSKAELLDRALDRYLERIDDRVVAQLDAPDAGPDTVLAFIDDLLDWVSQPSRPGCMMLNLLAERASGPATLVERAEAYRQRLRGALEHALREAGPEVAHQRANLLLAGAMGINIAASGQATKAELDDLADGLRSQVRAWG